LPNTLRRLTIFEDFDEYFNKYFQGGSPLHAEPVRTAAPFVGAALAQASLSLEELSASFIIDAKDFFEACQPTWTWNNLTSLALTSRLLDSDKNNPAVNKMMHDASSAALNMPKLRILEIWTAGKDHACVFRYRATSNSATITWRGTWSPRSADLVKPWKRVALKYSRDRLNTEGYSKMNVHVRSYGEAIGELQLQQQVVHQLSMLQILLEGRP
jgi:hypothetical protein